MEKLERLAKAVLSGDAQEAKDVSEDLLSSGCDPQEILDKGLLAGMQLVGEKFKNKSFYIPEVLLSSRAVHAGLNIIKPELTSQADAEKLSTVVIGSVAGDLHDIGKNLVVLLLRANNFKVIDLGIDVTPESFLEAVSKYKPEILGLSALLTITMAVIPETIQLIEKEGFRDNLKIMVGGAPVTREFALTVGADGYGYDAREAVEAALGLVKNIRNVI